MLSLCIRGREGNAPATKVCGRAAYSIYLADDLFRRQQTAIESGSFPGHSERRFYTSARNWADCSDLPTGAGALPRFRSSTGCKILFLDVKCGINRYNQHHQTEETAFLSSHTISPSVVVASPASLQSGATASNGINNSIHSGGQPVQLMPATTAVSATWIHSNQTSANLDSLMGDSPSDQESGIIEQNVS